MSDAARRVLERAQTIPEGFVRTYGDLSPGAPRFTGHALRQAGRAGIAVPWHRVVRADGSLTQGERQRALLEAEGVPFDERGRVELRVARLPPMPWISRDVTLAARPRGLHLVTREVLDAIPELRDLRAGLLHLFLQHTSAGLTLTENASPDVRRDLRSWLDETAPEGRRWEHSLEGPDDMPAHVKTLLAGAALTIPVRDGEPQLGTWQGICLCEFRDLGGPRRLVLTLAGE